MSDQTSPSVPSMPLPFHVTKITRGYGQYRVECFACPFWEFYEDETTAQRERLRHEQTAQNGHSDD